MSLLNVGPLILCLCCGTTYAPEGDCPFLETVEHSPELAQHIVAVLMERGVNDPTGDDVRAVRALLSR